MRGADSIPVSVTVPRPPVRDPRAPLPPPGGRGRGRLPLLAALLAVAWVAVGGIGTYVYVHRYWLYRGFPPNVTPAGIPRGTLRQVHFYSTALRQERKYLIYLPPHYRRAVRHGRRFPALYLLHAPPGRWDGLFKAGALDVAANVGIAHRRIHPMVLVEPYGKTPAYGNDTEWANAKAGRFESYVLDVVRNVDHRFATLRDRRHRGIAGLSEGGYGAINIALHHLSLFSVAESWSGYFIQTRTGPFVGASPAQLYANSPALYLPAVAPEIRRLGLRTYLYQGTLDPINPRHIRSFAPALHRAGALVGYGFYPGGHDWGLWRHQIPHMLRLASRWFARPAHDYSLATPLRAVGRPASKAARARDERRRRRQHCLRLLPELRPRSCSHVLARHSRGAR